MNSLTRNVICRPLIATILLTATGCAPLTPSGEAGLARRDQGRLQPQSVDGPCQVDKFFLLGFTAVHTAMTVSRGAPGCTFTVLDPNLQAFPTAVLVTTTPSHGTAQAGLTEGGRQAVVRYTPQPGYAGPDRFTVTIEPSDHAIAVAVTVSP